MALDIQNKKRDAEPSKSLVMDSDRVQGQYIVRESLIATRFEMVRRLAASPNLPPPAQAFLSSIVGSAVWKGLSTGKHGDLVLKQTDPYKWITDNIRIDPFLDLSPNPLDFGRCSSRQGHSDLRVGYVAKSKGQLSATVDGSAFAVSSLVAETTYPKITINQWGDVSTSPNTISAFPGQSVDVAAGHPCGVIVSFNPAGNLADGHYTGILHLHSPDGDAKVQLQGEIVTVGDVVVTGGGHMSVAQGKGTSVNLSIKAVAAPAHVVVTATQLPNGLTLQPVSVDVAAGASPGIDASLRRGFRCRRRKEPSRPARLPRGCE